MLRPLLKFGTVVRQLMALLDRWYWVLLLAVAPFLLFPSPTRPLLLLILPGAYLLLFVAGFQPIVSTPFNGAILLLSLMVVGSVFVTYDFAVSLPKVAGMVLAIATFYTVARLGRQPCVWWLCFLALIGAGAGLAIVALVGTQWQVKIGFFAPVIALLPALLRGVQGAEEGFNPNAIAGVLLWVLPAWGSATVLLFQGDSEVRAKVGQSALLLLQAVASTTTVLVLGVFLLAQSRSGYIGFIVGGSFLFLLIRSRRQRWLTLGTFVILMLMVGLGFLLLRANTVALPAVGSASTPDPMLSLDTLESRAELWERAFYAIHDFPFTGMGMNTFRHLVHVLYPLFLHSPDMDIVHAHNEFLQAALDLGLPGLVAFLAIHMIAFWLLYAIWRSVAVKPSECAACQAPSLCLRLLMRNLHILTLGLAGGLFMHMIYGLTDAVALGAKPGILFWLLLGLIASLFHQAQAYQHRKE